MKKSSKIGTIIIIVLTVVLTYFAYRIVDTIVYAKDMKSINAIEKYKSQVVNLEAIELEKANKIVNEIQERLEDFKLRLQITTAEISFNFVPIEKSDFFGKNSITYKYYYDYDIGCEVDNLKVMYDNTIKKAVIILPKEKFKIYRVRENVNRREIIERKLSGVNKSLEGKLGLGNITSLEVEANQKAALAHAENILRNKKEAWYDGEYNELEDAYRALIDKMLEFLKSSGIDIKRLEVN